MARQTDHTTSRSPHKLKRFWISVSAAAAVILCAPLIQHLLGYPPFPLRVQLSTGPIIFVLLVPAFWVAFSPRSDITRRFALISIAIILIILAVVLWLYR